MPKAYFRDRRELKIERPLVEIELPDFIVLAEEILEAELEAERERIRILNKTPVAVLTPAQVLKRQRAQARKQKKLLEFADVLPAWFVNPLNGAEAEVEEFEENQAIQAQAAAAVVAKKEAELQAEISLRAQQAARQKTFEV